MLLPCQFTFTDISRHAVAKTDVIGIASLNKTGRNEVVWCFGKHTNDVLFKGR
jgi:aconitase B